MARALAGSSPRGRRLLRHASTANLCQLGRKSNDRLETKQKFSELAGKARRVGITALNERLRVASGRNGAEGFR